MTESALIAEIGDIRRFPNANKLARFAGIAPVYYGSGGKGKEHKRKREIGRCTLYFITSLYSKYKWLKEVNSRETQCSMLTINGNIKKAKQKNKY